MCKCIQYIEAHVSLSTALPHHGTKEAVTFRTCRTCGAWFSTITLQTSKLIIGTKNSNIMALIFREISDRFGPEIKRAPHTFGPGSP